MKNKKTPLYIVPHSHWDREWYFTKATGDVLLNHMLNDIFHYGEGSPQMLDGQFSLLDDYLSANPTKKDRIVQLLQAKHLGCGPFYTQPDLFNSTAETTFRNIEMGQKIARAWLVPMLQTAYLPDTFGFPANLPQILQKKGLTNFVFWRGINEETAAKSAYFKWLGIDGTSIRAYNFHNGYYQLGQYYPYNQTEQDKLAKNEHKFRLALEKAANQIVVQHSNAKLLPLGGDQAPYLHAATRHISAKADFQSAYQITLCSNYDAFFANNIPPRISYQGSLRTPLTGKIHRTISSNRYDLKHAFRVAETGLYHLLEPLELLYAQADRDYDFDSFKDEQIIKPLLIAQAHDSLGGCNTDITNKRALARLDKVIDSTMAQVDLLLKKLLNKRGITEQTLAIFNPLPFANELFTRQTIYSKNPHLSISKTGFHVFTLQSRNISLVPAKPVYKQDVVVLKTALQPLALTTMALANRHQLKPDRQSESQKQIAALTIQGAWLRFVIGTTTFQITFKATTDAGDNYDFSPGPAIDLKQTHTYKRVLKLGANHDFVELHSKLRINKTVSNVTWNLFFTKEKAMVKTTFKINNRFKNTRLSLLINKHYRAVAKSQHLAIAPFVSDDFRPDWQAQYNEYPAHIDHNDGLIQIDKLHVLTSGTNEFYKHPSGIELVLYRTHGDVTRANMAWRPSTSGLSFKWKAPGSQLQKVLAFELGFRETKRPMAALNEWRFVPYLYKAQSRNFIANKMVKFVLNDIIGLQTKPFQLAISDPNIRISAIRKQNKGFTMRLANMLNEPKEVIIKINKQSKVLRFKPFEIKETEVKGVF